MSKGAAETIPTVTISIETELNAANDEINQLNEHIADIKRRDAEHDKAVKGAIKQMEAWRFAICNNSSLDYLQVTMLHEIDKSIYSLREFYPKEDEDN